MIYDNLISGLIERGFQGTEKIFNIGDCHLRGEHFILHTDGLIIYSTIPHWRRDTHAVLWRLDDEFSFEKLDEILYEKVRKTSP